MILKKKGKERPKEVLQTLFILFAKKNIASSRDDIIRYGNKFRIFFFFQKDFIKSF